MNLTPNARSASNFQFSIFNFQSPVLFTATLFAAPRVLIGCFLFFVLEISHAASFSNPASVIIVVGAPGELEFGSNFVHSATLWQEACRRADCRCLTLGLDSDSPTNDFTRLERTLAEEPKEGPMPLWLILIGHGTFDGKEARFNLRGPDVTGSTLAQWLGQFTRPLAVVDASSCSAPLLSKLSGTNRVVVTATRTGNEQYYVHFGTYLAEAIANPQADLDKDGQVSVLEAFLSASRRTAQFYKTEGRIATEHALLDDNGDNLGTPADWFRGLRATKKAKDNAGVDGLFAGQFCLVPSQSERSLTAELRNRRNALERAVFVFRERKGTLPEDEYYGQLEKLLLDLARFYASNINPGPSP